MGSPVHIIYLDFQKAMTKCHIKDYSTVLKLKAHGFGDGIIDWIEQWLTDMRQRVVVDGEVSNWKSVFSGVPQGSVLGPLFFLVYIYIYQRQYNKQRTDICGRHKSVYKG